MISWNSIGCKGIQEEYAVQKAFFSLWDLKEGTDREDKVVEQ